MQLEKSFTQPTAAAESVNPTIWTFWDGNAPDLVLRCIESIRRQNPHRRVVVVSTATLPIFLTEDDYPLFHGRRGGPQDFSSPQYLADWVRLTLLDKYGGVWFDASVICTKPVESWCGSAAGGGDEKLTLFNMHANPNVHGNWAMAAHKPGHPLIRAWREELSAIFNECGAGQVPSSYAAKAFSAHPNLVDLWNKPSPPPLPYLWVYLALQVVLQEKPHLHASVNLMESTNGPMYRRYELNINQGILDPIELSEATASHLANEPMCPESHDEYFIKLVGKDRGPCQARLDARDFQANSPLEYLHSMTPRSIVYGKNLQEIVLKSNLRFRTAAHAVLATQYLTEAGHTGKLQRRQSVAKAA